MGLGEFSQWRATVTLEGVAADITVNVRALRAGLVSVSPPNSLSVGNGSLTGQSVGLSSIVFAGSSSFVNVNNGSVPVVSLQTIFFTQMAFSAAGSTLVATFIGHVLAPGQRGYTLVVGTYGDGASVVLAHSHDLITTAIGDVTVGLDGSLLAVLAAKASAGPIASVAYRGMTEVVAASIDTPTPLGLQACCDVTLAARGSAMHGLLGIGANFSLSVLKVTLKGGKGSTLAMNDLRVSELHDPAVLSFSSGLWTVVDNPRIGQSSVTLTYTQPGTLTRVRANVTVTVVDAKRLLITASYPRGGWGGVLYRLHCSGAFQSIRFSAVLDAGVLQAVLQTELTVVSSNETILSPAGQMTLVGAVPGRSMVTVTGRGFEAVQSVMVSDLSEPVVSLAAPEYRLAGTIGARFPCRLVGTLRSGTFLQDLETLLPLLVDPPQELGYDEGSLVLQGSSVPMGGSLVTFGLQSCSGYAPTATGRVRVSAQGPVGGRDVEIVVSNGGRLMNLSLLSGNSAGFYAEVFTDGQITGCQTAPLPGVLACSVDPDSSRALFAGAVAGAYDSRTPFGSVTLQDPPQWVDGRLETADADNFGAWRGPVVVGRLGTPPSAYAVTELPVVDSGTLARQYAGVMSGGGPGLRTLLDSLLLLVGKTMLVDPRLYSNDFELSAMFRVTDRFLRPINAGRAANLTVLFRTDLLPAIQGSVQTEEGLWTPADYMQDGWFLAEWRQQIPALNVSVAYTLRLSDDWADATTWELPGLLETGVVLAQCPRGGYATGTILALFVADGNGTLAPSQDVVRRMACAMRVAARRILVSQDSQGRLSLAVAVESFNRLSETNFAVMNDWFADTFLPLLNFTPWRMDRDGVAYINDTADQRRPCPLGLFQDPSGAMTPLPMHADPGADCVGFVCSQGYQRGDLACVPASLPADMLWTVIVLVLGLVAAGMTLLCVLQLACRPRPGEEVRFDPGEEAAPVEPEPVDEMTEIDLDAAGMVWLDDNSRAMLEGEFSPLPAHVQRLH